MTQDTPDLYLPYTEIKVPFGNSSATIKVHADAAGELFVAMVTIEASYFAQSDDAAAAIQEAKDFLRTHTLTFVPKAEP